MVAWLVLLLSPAIVKLLLLYPVHFEPDECALLDMDGVAHSLDQVISAAPVTRLQGAEHQRQSLQLQLLHPHNLHHITLS